MFKTGIFSYSRSYNRYWCKGLQGVCWVLSAVWRCTYYVLSLCFMLCLLDPVLLDLPLPTHVPTPMEHSLLFPTTLKDESSKLLQNTNKDVVRNIVSVIERVKMDYLWVFCNISGSASMEFLRSCMYCILMHTQVISHSIYLSMYSTCYASPNASGTWVIWWCLRRTSILFVKVQSWILTLFDDFFIVNSKVIWLKTIPWQSTANCLHWLGVSWHRGTPIHT